MSDDQRFCYICGEEMVKRVKDVEVKWRGKHRYVFSNIEVWVCPACGDEMYDPEVAGYMLREAQRRSEERQEYSLPVEKGE